MALTIAPSKNYPSPLNALPTKLRRDAPESDKVIPVEIDWGVMGQSVAFNLADNATLTFSQLVSINVDNSQCGADVVLTFPDTSDTVTIPAYSPRVICPVFTNQLMFYAATIGGETEDVTRLMLCNFIPPPIAVPTTQEQEFANIASVNTQANGSQQLIPASVNGTLEGLSITSMPNAAAGSTAYYTYIIEDGNSNVIATCNDWCGPGPNRGQIVFSNEALRVRFQNGVKLVWTVTGSTGSNSSVAVNLFYRSP